MSLREEVEANGFAIRDIAVTDAGLMQALDEDIRRSPLRNKAGMRHAMSLRSVRDIASCQAMRKLAYEILGGSAFPFRATIFEKSPAANWLVVWHQDTALPLEHKLDVLGWGPWSTKQGIQYAHAPAEVLSQVLALRLHLDDSTSENGPLRVLPGTHNLGLLSDDDIHALSEQIRSVECVVPKGGVVAMRPLVLHASSKSRTELPRRVLHIEYAASESIASPLDLEIV